MLRTSSERSFSLVINASTFKESSLGRPRLTQCSTSAARRATRAGYPNRQEDGGRGRDAGSGGVAITSSLGLAESVVPNSLELAQGAEAAGGGDTMGGDAPQLRECEWGFRQTTLVFSAA